MLVPVDKEYLFKVQSYKSLRIKFNATLIRTRLQRKAFIFGRSWKNSQELYFWREIDKQFKVEYIPFSKAFVFAVYNRKMERT